MWIRRFYDNKFDRLYGDIQSNREELGSDATDLMMLYTVILNPVKFIICAILYIPQIWITMLVINFLYQHSRGMMFLPCLIVFLIIWSMIKQGKNIYAFYMYNYLFIWTKPLMFWYKHPIKSIWYSLDYIICVIPYALTHDPSLLLHPTREHM